MKTRLAPQPERRIHRLHDSPRVMKERARARFRRRSELDYDSIPGQRASLGQPPNAEGLLLRGSRRLRKMWPRVQDAGERMLREQGVPPLTLGRRSAGRPPKGEESDRRRSPRFSANLAGGRRPRAERGGPDRGLAADRLWRRTAGPLVASARLPAKSAATIGASISPGQRTASDTLPGNEEAAGGRSFIGQYKESCTKDKPRHAVLVSRHTRIAPRG